MFKELKYRYTQFKERRFLKKHGCTTWEQFDRKYDVDISRYANDTKTYYVGYPYIYIFKDSSKEVFSKHRDWFEGYKEIEEWCKKNCIDKYRSDIHRVLETTYIDQDGNLDTEYRFNDIGGYDYLFYAFKNDTDYIWFVTRWA